MSKKGKKDYIGTRSQGRGVKLVCLLIFTKTFDCWDWTAAEVICKIIKPLTEDAKYRLVELPCMKGHTSEAKNLCLLYTS